jgi:hypothetical protein
MFFLLIFSYSFLNAQSQCGIRPDGARAVQIGSKPGINASVRIGLDKVCLMQGVSNLDFAAFLTIIDRFSTSDLNLFFSDFGLDNTGLELVVKDLIILNIWRTNSTNINRTNTAWLQWVKNGRRRVPELTQEVVAGHIYKGVVTIEFKDATPMFTASPREIWAVMEDKFKSDAVFAAGLLRQDNIAGVSFDGLHSIDEINSLKSITLVDGQALLSYTSSPQTPTTDILGKKAYGVVDPAIWIPSTDDIKSINKNKTLANRVWTRKSKKMSKKSKLSSTFLEGMTEIQIETMISEAFIVRQMNGYLWNGVISFNGKKIEIEGYLRSSIITSAFLKKID